MLETTRYQIRAVFLAIVVLVFYLYPGAAGAQEIRKWELGAFGGFQTFADGNRLSIPDDGSTSGLELPKDRSFIGGLRLGWAPITFAAIELEVGQSTTNFSNTTVDVSTLLYRLQVLINLTGSGNGLKAFLLGGIGGIHGTPSEAFVMLQEQGQNFSFETSSETDLETHLGGGLKYYLGVSLGARLDVRMRWPSSQADHPRRELEGLAGIFVRF